MDISFELLEIDSGAGGKLYSPHFADQTEHEFDRFFENPRCRARPEFEDMLVRMDYMVHEAGFYEHFFKTANYPPPTAAFRYEKGQLRLYCIRYSKKTLVVGNGGVKKPDVYRLQEDEHLKDAFERISYVAQRIQRRLNDGRLMLTKQGIISLKSDAFTFDA